MFCCHFSATSLWLSVFKSRRVLFCQLLWPVKKRKKKHAHFSAKQPKTRADAASMTVPTPVLAVFSYIKGYFAPESMKETSLVLVDKRGF